MTELNLEEHTFAKFVDNVQQIWDTSSLDAFLKCPQYYKLNTIEGWKISSESIDPLWGSAIHDAFEVLDTNRFKGNKKDEAINEAIRLLITKYGALQYSDNTKKNLETACRAVVWRADEHYYSDTAKIMPLPNGEPALEVRFELPFEDTGYRFSGRIDKVVTLNDQLFIVDTKTTASSLSNYYFDRYAPANQIYTYIWATREQLGLPVAGFIIDAVSTGVNFTRFGRQQFNVRESQINEWIHSVKYQLKCVEDFHTIEEWPRNFAGCGNYGGCSYRDICRNAPEHRQAFLDAEFKLAPYGTRVTTEKENT